MNNRPGQNAGSDGAVPPALQRLRSLAPFDDAAYAAVMASIRLARPIPAKGEIITEGSEVRDQKLVVTGWLARVRHLPDGRRQLLGFLLPGDLIGFCIQPDPLAVSTIVALTEASLCPAPAASRSDALTRAYRISHALEGAYFLAQITRLGSFDGYGRIIDLLLEFNDRLSLAGIATEGSFSLPLTQEVLAEALGLTSVHVNRMLQRARREEDLSWRSGRIALRDPALLAESVGHVPACVSKFQP
jgi:CRP-like cAMP-binding protein